MQKYKELILIYGCPGSGKSTFSRFMASRWDRSVLIVSGDEIECLVSVYGTEIVIGQFSKIKQQTIKETFKLGTLLFPEASIKQYKENGFDPQIWQESRKLIKQYLPVFLSIAQTVIIQDDMLLKSIRKVFRSYCCDNNVLFLEILMKTSLQNCIRSNFLRGITVSEDVITDKFSKLEVGEGLQLEYTQRNDQRIFQVIKKNLKVPQKLQTATSIKIQYNNELEQTDIAIRKIISQIITSQQKIEQLFGRKASKKQVGQMISLFKKQYNLKEGHEKFENSLKQYLQYRNLN